MPSGASAPEREASATERPVITWESTVEEVVSRYPATARVFIARRMHCVGCSVAPFESVLEACHIYGQPPEVLLGELRTAATQRRRRPSTLTTR